MAAAVAALAGAVAVLWKDARDRHTALERRTESHLAVATKQTEVLALLDVRVSDVGQRLERIGSERTAQIDDLSRKVEAYHETDSVQHAGQMRSLAAIEALLRPAVEPIRTREPMER